MPFAFHYAARSDVGMVRSNNEDSGYAGPHLLAMADGMGGHAGGDVASSTVVAALVGLDGEALSGRDAGQALLDRIHAAVQQALGSEQVKRIWIEHGARVELESRADFANFIARETERWSRIAKAANVQME